MADICVIFASENEEIAQKLVTYLRKYWEVFWAEDITDGDWEQQVRDKIIDARAVVPIVSRYTKDKPIFRDELKYADKNGKLIFPFFVDEADLPFGYGDYNRTEAYGWNGEENNKGLLKLKRKLDGRLGTNKSMARESILSINNKNIKLPSFVFSLSSHDTQVSPEDGVELLHALQPQTCLISAYDAWKLHEKNDERFFSYVQKICDSNSVLFLDSGNYEAGRKNDHLSKDNLKGWNQKKYHEIAKIISPDIVFAYDEINPQGHMDEIFESLVSNYHIDVEVINNPNIPVCPIIHFPKNQTNINKENISELVSRITTEIDPIMVAIPERELGDGLFERFLNVRAIRQGLNKLGKYYPLHLLGTGNPLSLIAFATAGADSFDGLEWCRTVADYNNNHLFHFSHFDFFYRHNISRVSSLEIRNIVSNLDAPYVARVASYNFDYFCDIIKTVQDMISKGQEEYLLKNIPNIGLQLFEELKK